MSFNITISSISGQNLFGRGMPHVAPDLVLRDGRDQIESQFGIALRSFRSQ